MLKPGSIESAARESYGAVLGFEDNQFKKHRVDKHDAVISMLHTLKQATLPSIPYEDDSGGDSEK